MNVEETNTFCGNCGIEMMFEPCTECGGDGILEHDEGMGWEGFHVSEYDIYCEICEECGGKGGFLACPQCHPEVLEAIE